MKRHRGVMFAMAGVMLCCVDAVRAGEGANVSYTYTQPSEGDFEDEVAQSEVKVSGAVKVLDAADHGFDLFVGGKFQANAWTFDDDRIDDIDLYKVMVPVTAGFKATDNIQMRVEVVPGIHSDWENVDGDDLRVDGSVVGTYLYHPYLQFVLGVGVGEDFGSISAYPVIGARWKATDEIFVNAVFPAPQVSYAFSKDLRAYISGEPTGGQWNIGHQNDDHADVDVQLKGYRVGIGGEYQVMDGGWLYAMVGRETGRTLQLAVNDAEVFDDDVDLDDAMFLQIGFRLM